MPNGFMFAPVRRADAPPDYADAGPAAPASVDSAIKQGRWQALPVVRRRAPAAHGFSGAGAGN
jgi:hypothetical protein